MKQVGIDVEIREYEGPYIKQLMRENNYQAASRNFEWVDADILYYVFTEASGYPWHDATVTEKLEEARYITDPVERVKKYEEFHDAFFAQMPAVSCSQMLTALRREAISRDLRLPMTEEVCLAIR